MTEIVKNNSSIKLDLLDMGNVGSDQSESEGVFNSLFGGIDAKDNTEVLSNSKNIDDIDQADRNMTEIINILKMADINLSENILEDIQNKLKELFFKNFSDFTNNLGLLKHSHISYILYRNPI